MRFDDQGNQPALTLIFRGKGLRISARERSLWDKRVHVRFQPSAWADTSFCIDYAKNIFPQLVDTTLPNLLFVDGLSAQQNVEFRKALLEFARTEVHVLVGDCTDSIQAVDNGVGKALKVAITRLWDDWLVDHIEEADSLTASDIRILTTRFAGEAWEGLCRDNSQMFRVAALHTGCLMTIDGSDDQEIKPQGAETGYSFDDADEGTADFESSTRALEVVGNDGNYSSDIEDNVCRLDSDSDDDDENIDGGADTSESDRGVNIFECEDDRLRSIGSMRGAVQDLRKDEEDNLNIALGLPVEILGFEARTS